MMTSETGASAKPALSIIVISYNTRDMTLECLSSVAAETSVSYELIVVDNASTDGSADAIALAFPQVRLIRETKNHGFGPAHQIAMQHVQCEWILLLNPDTVILDGAIDALIDFASKAPEAGIWGGRTFYGDGSLNPTSCFARMTLWSVLCRVAGLNGVFRKSALFNSEYYGDWQRDTEREVDIVTGCFLLIRRETWNLLKGFDQAFAMYGEEVDLCLRGREIGLRPRVTPEATIIHHGGASQAVKSDKLVRLLKAKMELIRRHFPDHQRALGLALFRLWPASRAFGFRVMALVTKQKGFKNKAQVWAEVWARRAEWENGFRLN
jgi:GT2 family glycosyltransferase